MTQPQKAVTSFRIDARTAEILRIINVPFIKVFNRGLAAYCIERKITNPRVIQLLKRYYEEVVEDRKAEEEFVAGLIRDIENPSPLRIDLTPGEDEQPIIQEERPSHIRPDAQTWLKTDSRYATVFLRNTLAHYLENELPHYNGDNKRVLADLTLLRDDPGTDGIDREGLDILLTRSDIESILTASVSEALKAI